MHPRKTECFAVSKVSLRGGEMLSVNFLFWEVVSFSFDLFGGELSTPEISSREYLLEASLDIESQDKGLKSVRESLS